MMTKHKAGISRTAILAILIVALSPATLLAQGNPGAIIRTSMGDIQLELIRRQGSPFC